MELAASSGPNRGSGCALVPELGHRQDLYEEVAANSGRVRGSARPAARWTPSLAPKEEKACSRERPTAVRYATESKARLRMSKMRERFEGVPSYPDLPTKIKSLYKERAASGGRGRCRARIGFELSICKKKSQKPVPESLPKGKTS